MQGFENYESVFAQSIGVVEPWKIEQTEFDEEKREVHVTVMARKTSKYPCPECGELCERYDDEDKERVWRHGDVVFSHALFIAADQESSVRNMASML